MSDYLKRYVWGLLFGLFLLLPAVPSDLAHAQTSGDQPERVVRVGVVDGPSPHYRFSFESGEATGFAIETWREVARLAGVKYRLIYFNDLQAMIRGAKSGLLDVVPLLPAESGSREVLDYSAPVHRSAIRIFTRKNSNEIDGARALIGRRVSFVEGEIGKTIVRGTRGALGISQDNIEEALNSLISQTSDALVHQEEVLWQQAQRQGVVSLMKSVGAPLQEVDLVIGVRKGQGELLARLNSALKTYKSSPAFWNSRQQWGGNPEPWVDPIAVAKVLVSALGIALIMLGVWRYLSVIRLNEALSLSIKEREDAEARFKDLAESASDWFFEQDRGGRLTFLSPRFELTTGLDPKNLLGKTRWQLSNAEMDDAQLNQHLATIDDQEDWQDFSYSVTNGKGETRILTTSGKAVFDDQGQFQGYRGVGRDITRRIELEQSLQQARKMEMVGQLTGGIAHDFNNLLTVLTGNLEMLKGRVVQDERARRYLATATEAADLGSKLTGQLLSFSRRQTLRPQRLDLNSLIEGMMGLVRSSVGHPTNVKLSLDDNLACVFADGSQLQNAILNLVINARDAMPAGGELTILTSEAELDEDFVAKNPSARPGTFVRLTVSDSGHGIAADELSKVIEPFYTTKEVGKGAGLGLSMVYGFASQSRGFLLIDSAPGAGTQVSIYLPIAEQPDEISKPDAVAALQAEQSARGETVLVVEDDDRVREITSIRLEEIGYTVLEANNAQAALATLKSRNDIDVLFTDVVMPGDLSGIDLAGRVCTDWPDIKILFATGYSKTAPTVGPDGELGYCLTKPYRQDELVRKMREVLDA